MASSSVSQRPVRRGFRINPWIIRLPILMITGSILVLMILGLFMFAFQMRYSEMVVPGVSALGMDLSGMTLEQATAALENSFEYGSDAVFTFRDGDRFWQLTAQELGVSFNAEETAAAAFAIGHDERDILNSMNGQAQAWFEGYTLSPIITYDQNVALTKLNTIAAEINRDAVNATLTLEGTGVIITDGQTGRQVDIAATLSRLNDRIAQLENGAEIPVVINETPPLVPSVAATTQLIETAFSAPVTLTATDQSGAQLGPWTVSVDQIAQLLRVSLINNGDGTQSYDVTIDMGAFETYLIRLAPGLLAPAVDGRFDFDPATAQLTAIQPAQSGRTLNVAETLRRLEEGVFTSENRLVPMAFDYTLSRYHNQISAAELGIRELVAESTTYFTGSSGNRRTNIAVGVSHLNGVIIAPGEEFSFNYYLGDISYENGFVDGLVIVADRTEAGIGGGICQVSTTMFRAAFTGGFAITERNSHGYRVGYYELNSQPTGMDAAIWQPERDFKFQNNTPHHLLIEATIYPGDNALQVRFYSTKHWQTEIDEPIIRNREPAPVARYVANRDLQLGQVLQVDFAAEGADVTVYRNVYDLSGNLVTEDFVYTHYLPWQSVFEVAPGDARLG
jgi:vancomycin resistance protein YoaR